MLTSHINRRRQHRRLFSQIFFSYLLNSPPSPSTATNHHGLYVSVPVRWWAAIPPDLHAHSTTDAVQLSLYRIRRLHHHFSSSQYLQISFAVSATCPALPCHEYALFPLFCCLPHPLPTSGVFAIMDCGSIVDVCALRHATFGLLASSLLHHLLLLIVVASKLSSLYRASQILTSHRAL